MSRQRPSLGAANNRVERISRVAPAPRFAGRPVTASREDCAPRRARLSRALRVFAWTTVAALVPCTVAQPESVRVAVLYGAKGPYETAAAALAETLRNSHVECTLIDIPANDDDARRAALEQLASTKPTLIAAGGTAATSLALDTVPEVPVVFFMVPNALDTPFLAEDSANRARVAGVSSDIDPAVQMEWVARTGRNVNRVAVLYSARSAQTVRALATAGREHDIDLVAIEADVDRFPESIETLTSSRCDGVLMIPDAKVYNSPNVQRLLLWGIRQQHPVWTFSDNVVKAGAFSGLSCDSAAVGRQAGTIVLRLTKGESPKAIGLQYPQEVGKAVNVHTAGMIDIPVNDRVFTAEVVRMGEHP